MQGRILIFIQASADFTFAVNLSKQFSEENSHILIVIQNDDLYKVTKNYFKNYSQVKLILISHRGISIKTPWLSIKTRLSVKRQLKEQLQVYLPYSKIYFFSRFYDYTTAFIIHELQKIGNASIYYVDHYDSISLRNNNDPHTNFLKSLRYKVLAQFITVLFQVKFISRYKNKPLEWDLSRIEYKRISHKKIIKTDHEKLNLNIPENSILFLISPDELNMIETESVEYLKIQILKLKTKGYKLILKGHPRLGSPSSISDVFDIILDHTIPAEVINFEKIIALYGIISTALIYIDCNHSLKRYTFINQLSFLDISRKEFFENYLKSLSIQEEKELNFI